LLHGDLWSGNVLFGNAGPCLIDPAVYYGDREADIAMTELFGGFSEAFYRAYDRLYPRTEVYAAKRAIYNLYHTLNHYNLFGASYLDACRRNLGVIARL
jgi:fructosamine-3-kinase